jgi:hypothetical protein
VGVDRVPLAFTRRITPVGPNCGLPVIATEIGIGRDSSLGGTVSAPSRRPCSERSVSRQVRPRVGGKVHLRLLGGKGRERDGAVLQAFRVPACLCLP